jgi:hypothetical protein
MTDEQRLVIPIGQFGGVIRGAGYIVRRGHDLVSLDPEPGRLWLDAHGSPDVVEETALTRSVLLGRSPVSADAAYRQLLDNGLVMEVDPDGSTALDFARSHRLLPAAHGMGNRPDQPTRFMAGFRPDHIVGFSWYLYRLWRKGVVEPTLWDACRALAAHDRCVRDSVDEHDLRTFLLREVHVLLHTRAAYFDVGRLPQDAGPATLHPAPVDARDTDPDELLMPVGHDLGPGYSGPDQPAAFFEVAVGRASFVLPTREDYTIWQRGHGPVDQLPLTLRGYSDNVLKENIPDVEKLAYRLSENGLLWQIPPTGEPAAEFASLHRIVPLGTAVGNTHGPDGWYALGPPGAVTHYAGEVEYWLWLWGGRFDSMWLACEALARTELGARTGDGDPYRCIGPVMLGAQTLIIRSLAFLDVAWDRA